jgi:outer membrane murein-binding lipoprotein Lpp
MTRFTLAAPNIQRRRSYFRPYNLLFMIVFTLMKMPSQTMKLSPWMFLAPVLVTLGAIFGYYAKQQAPASAHATTDVATRQRLTPTTHAPFEADRMTRLEAELRQLSAKVAQLESQQPALRAPAEQVSTRNNPQTGTRFSRDANETASLADNLVKAGLEPWRAEDIARNQSQQALARLELRDKAVRENYLRTRRFRQEMQELEASAPSVRDEIGVDTYDKYLYQSGQSNRVAISSVMTGSAAEQAGILDGDLILSYDNQRLFNYRQLRGLTTAGERGETINITVSRGGSEVSLALPRGPLGVGLETASVDPQQ